MSAEVLPHTIEPHPITGMYNGKFGIWLFLASEVMLFAAMFSTYVLLRVGAPSAADKAAPYYWTAWPHGAEKHLSVPIGTVNTLLLIVSSVTIVMAWASLKMHDFARARVFLAATLLLALAFLVVKLTFEYSPKLHHYKVWLQSSPTEPLTGHVEEQTADHIVFLPDSHGGEANHAQAMHIERKDILHLSNFGPSHNAFFATYWTVTGLHGLHVLGGILVIGYFLLTGASMWQREPERFTNRVECTGLYWHFVDLVWIFVFPVMYLL